MLLQITLDTDSPADLAMAETLFEALGASGPTEIPPKPKKAPKTPSRASETPSEPEATPEEPADDRESLVETAVARATELLKSGKADVVIAALAVAGAEKVTALKTTDQLNAFVAHLDSAS